MKFKDGSINPIGLRTEMLLGIMVARDIWLQRGHDLVITSMNDGPHADRSLHYTGCAADFRVPLEEGGILASLLSEALTADYDVVLEGDHVHLEYQPEKRDYHG